MAVKDGIGDKKHHQLVPFDSQAISKSEELVKYGDEVTKLALAALNELTEDDLTKEITYPQWNNFKLAVKPSLGTINEEMTHHRGQLSVYLRLLGIDPPFLYDFS